MFWSFELRFEANKLKLQTLNLETALQRQYYVDPFNCFVAGILENK